MWPSCLHECPGTLPDTTSSSTSTHTRVTPWSLWVSSRGWAGARDVRATQASWLTPLCPTVFIYSMPGYKCSIKERMLYSSCKSRLLDSVEQDFQLQISKKVGIPGPVTQS